MPAGGGFLNRTRRAAPLLLLLGLGGCVQDAMLDNDISRAHARERALATAADLSIAEAALAAQLVELEALYLRDKRDYRARSVLDLLDRGYALMAHGFIEVRRLDAVAAGDTARAEQERRLQADATERSRSYRGLAAGLPLGGPPRLDLQAQFFGGAEAACQARDRASYEQYLSALLARSARSPSDRLALALAKRQAAAWLMPNVSARCGFEAAPTVAAPPAPPPASR